VRLEPLCARQSPACGVVFGRDRHQQAAGDRHAARNRRDHADQESKPVADGGRQCEAFRQNVELFQHEVERDEDEERARDLEIVPAGVPATVGGSAPLLPWADGVALAAEAFAKRVDGQIARITDFGSARRIIGFHTAHARELLERPLD